jgi:hypothetical protein
MDMFAICYQSFAVLSIYYFWNAYVQARLQRERTLRERITYMLWVMADRVV